MPSSAPEFARSRANRPAPAPADLPPPPRTPRIPFTCAPLSCASPLPSPAPFPSAPLLIPSRRQPQIILLRDGTDESQGKAQLISNINACQAVAEAVRTTLGPRGMDKLIHDGQKVRARGGLRATTAGGRGACDKPASPPS